MTLHQLCFRLAETIIEMIIYESSGLQKGIVCHRAEETAPPFIQILTDGIGDTLHTAVLIHTNHI